IKVKMAYNEFKELNKEFINDFGHTVNVQDKVNHIESESEEAQKEGIFPH
ncbi:5255_t:CDS:1, partial [Cetraspora pellucida]